MNQLGLFFTKQEIRFPMMIPVFYQLSAALSFAITGYLIKILTTIPATQILFTRSAIALIGNYFFTNQLQMDLYPKNSSIRNKLILRGVFGGIGAFSWMQGIKLLPLSEGIVLQRSSPLWTTVIAVYILRVEEFSYSLIFDLFLCIVGVIFIAKPPMLLDILASTGFMEEIQASKQTYPYHYVGVLLCLTTSLTATTIQIMISSLSGKVNQFVIFQYFSFLTIPVPALIQLYSPLIEVKFPNFDELMVIVVISMLGWVGQILMNRSFLKGDLTQISLVGQSQVLFSYFIDTFILNEKIDDLSLIGIVMVVSGLALSILKKQRKTK